MKKNKIQTTTLLANILGLLVVAEMTMEMFLHHYVA